MKGRSTQARRHVKFGRLTSPSLPLTLHPSHPLSLPTSLPSRLAPGRDDLTAPAKPRFEVFRPQKFFARRRRLIRAIASRRVAPRRVATASHCIALHRARRGIFRGAATERTRREIANLIVAAIKAHGRRFSSEAVIGRGRDGRGGGSSDDGDSTDTSADSR